MSPGKNFEQCFKNSVPPSCYIYRFKDSATSFSNATNTRFTPSNICDYLLLDDPSRTMYLLELKSTKSASLSLNNIRETQIKELTKASNHNLVAGFVVNFREKDNFTAFISIQNFNRMMEKINKKSFNIQNMMDYGAIEIENKLLRTNFKYDIEKFISKTKLGNKGE